MLLLEVTGIEYCSRHYSKFKWHLPENPQGKMELKIGPVTRGFLEDLVEMCRGGPSAMLLLAKHVTQQLDNHKFSSNFAQLGVDNFVQQLY